MRNGWRTAIIAGACAVAGCGDGGGAPNGDILANSLTPPAQQSASVDSWVGRWSGPEGLFLDIMPDLAGPGRYTLAIKADLDSDSGGFAGTAEGGTIRFERGGQQLTVRPGAGAETGFKWLADKRDCLIVVPDKEGYCRD